jgi:hypothetical protein
MASESEGDTKRVEIKLDLDQLARIMDVGIRRASAFLKLGIQIADIDMPEDMSLTGGVSFNFWPKELSKEVKENIREEFRAWLIGSCLRELDQHLAIFLDRAWRIIELSELHGRRMQSSELIEFDKDFVDDTNTFRKFKALSDKIEIDLAEDCHNSLSLARNSLTHGLGRVRSRDCNRDGSLEVLWISPQMVIQDGDREIVIRTEVFDSYQVASLDGATISVHFVKHSKTFKLGDKIELSPHELAEICFFYKQQADVTRAGLFNYLKAKGLASDAT